jgi:hypothetical protein
MLKRFYNYRRIPLLKWCKLGYTTDMDTKFKADVNSSAEEENIF